METFENVYTGLRKGWFFRTVLLLCLLICVYFALVSAAPLFPVLRLNEHLKDAALLLEKEGTYYMPFGQMPTMDNFTDAIMLNVTGTLDPREPIRSGMRMNISYIPDDTELHDSIPELIPIQDFKNFVEGKATKTWSYARYWHGYVAFLRPMLSVMAFADVRKLSFFVLMMLFSAAMFLLARKTDWIVTVSFAVSMILGGFPILAFCMEYVDSFVIALAVMCVILHWNIRDEERLVRLFLLSGSLTTFIAFGGLTAPIVTLMFPLLALALPDLEMRLFRWDWRYVKRLILFGIVWSTGYLLTWGAKWILADIILGNGLVVLRDATDSILLRSGSGMTFFIRMIPIVTNINAILPFSVPITGTGRGPVLLSIAETEGLMPMIKEFVSTLPSSTLLGFAVTTLVLVVYLIVIVCLAVDSKKRRSIGTLGYFSLAFLFLIPYFWYFVTAGHANHGFVFRNQIPSLWLFLILPHIMKKKETGDTSLQRSL